MCLIHLLVIKGAISHHNITLVCLKRLPHFEFLKVKNPVGAVLKADQMRVIISLNKGNHMIVLDSNTGIVSATVREMALGLDLAQLQVLSVEEEGIICTGLIVCFSAQYNNCLIVQSGD